MKHLTRDDVQAERLLRASRSIAVLGASARAGDRSSAVVEYLKRSGYEVQPVRADQAEVAGLRAWARLADVPGAVDLVLVLRGRVDTDVMEGARRKKARAVWLAPGAALAGAAVAGGPVVIQHRDIVEVDRATEQVAGKPRKLTAVSLRRGRPVEDDRKRREKTGWVARGGGGKRGGGGGRAVLDEKKMLGGRPSPRTGPRK